jgi:hypothetical protein
MGRRKNKKLAFIMKNRKRKGMQAHRARKAEENRAALFITAAIRGVAWRNTLEDWKDASIYLQGIYRKRLAIKRITKMHWAATVVQCNYRRHQFAREQARRNAEASRLQKIYRGGGERERLRRIREAANRVVQTPWAVEDLRKRSKEERATDDRSVLQMRDPKTGQLWYYTTDTREAFWNAPKTFHEQSMFHCRWDDCTGPADNICREKFKSQRELDEHRAWKHSWRCAAC